MENPIKMDDLGVPLFSETPISLGILFGSGMGIVWVRDPLKSHRFKVRR